jgi:integrase
MRNQIGIKKTSETIDLNVLRNYLDKLDLTKHENINVWLYFQIAMKTGLRSIDIINLKGSNFVVKGKDTNLVGVEQKTNKDYNIPFNYPQILEKINLSNDFVLWSETYKRPISLMTINRRLKSALNDNKGVSSHSIRKSIAMEIYKKTNNDIISTMLFLRHSSVTTTQLYLNLKNNEVRKLYSLLD